MRRLGALILAAAAAGVLFPGPLPVGARDFYDDLERVDRALQANPRRLTWEILESCRARRNTAIRLYDSGHRDRVDRSLAFCRGLLKIPDPPPQSEQAEQAPPSMREVQARAAREVERALALTPNTANGLEIYRRCAACHEPEGWGLSNGSVPQIAGQHRTVVVKQLADIRAGNRDGLLMLPYASVESIGGAQAVADVAGYIDTLEISVDTGKGPGDDLELGERLYRENCARCHGPTGEGDAERYMPRIQAQHYNYLVRQFERIRQGTRRNADPEMTAQIQGFGDRETRAVMDYVSRLEPPEDFRAPPGWRNPDFAGWTFGAPPPSR